MESHPYTKPRGVGPVTTQLTPGAQPASWKSAGAPGPWSCSPTCRAWSESSMPSFTDSTSSGKTTPSAFLHKQLDVTALLGARAIVDRDVKIEHARIAHSERLYGCGLYLEPVQ